MSFKIRSSKFRHVFGTPAKKDKCFDNVRLTRCAWDFNFISASAKFVAICWASGGGGAFACIPLDQPGKIPADVGLFAGHKGLIMDLEFSPFNDNIIATGAEDCTVKIWNIPDGGGPVGEHIEDSSATLHGHQRKVGHLKWHPNAANVLCSTATDLTTKIWDVEAGKEMLNLEGHGDVVQSMDWFSGGKQLITTCKDKIVRVWDVREQKCVMETKGHPGIKASRCVDLQKNDMFFTVGFGRSSDRQFNIFDVKSFEKPIHKQDIDQSSGIIMPFYDADSSVLFLAGKGDGNIRFYEIVTEKPYCHFLSEHKSAHAQRGMCMKPKRANDVSHNEIVHLLKLEQNRVEPLSMKVPRKSELFQEDLFPDCLSGEPGCTAEEWFGGSDEPAKRIAMSANFVAPEAKAEMHVSEEAAASGKKTLSAKEMGEKIAKLEAEVATKDTRIRQLEAQLAQLKAE